MNSFLFHCVYFAKGMLFIVCHCHSIITESYPLRLLTFSTKSHWYTKRWFPTLKFAEIDQFCGTFSKEVKVSAHVSEIDWLIKCHSVFTVVNHYCRIVTRQSMHTQCQPSWHVTFTAILWPSHIRSSPVLCTLPAGQTEVAGEHADPRSRHAGTHGHYREGTLALPLRQEPALGRWGQVGAVHSASLGSTGSPLALLCVPNAWWGWWRWAWVS